MLERSGIKDFCMKLEVRHELAAVLLDKREITDAPSLPRLNAMRVVFASVDQWWIAGVKLSSCHGIP